MGLGKEEWPIEREGLGLRKRGVANREGGIGIEEKRSGQ